MKLESSRHPNNQSVFRDDSELAVTSLLGLTVGATAWGARVVWCLTWRPSLGLHCCDKCQHQKQKTSGKIWFDSKRRGLGGLGSQSAGSIAVDPGWLQIAFRDSGKESDSSHGGEEAEGQAGKDRAICNLQGPPPLACSLQQGPASFQFHHLMNQILRRTRCLSLRSSEPSS